MKRSVALFGVPLQAGTDQSGCLMGPDALRTAGLSSALADLGCQVDDRGNLNINDCLHEAHDNDAIRNLAEVAAWTKELQQKAETCFLEGAFPIFMGGDHSLAAGTVTGVASAAAKQGKEQFVLWLDAHPDLHRLDTTRSGNLHGTPSAYFCGFDGFEPHFPKPPATVPTRNVCMMGLRSVDAPEREILQTTPLHAYDMRAIDERGVAGPLNRFLEMVAERDGNLHLSFDVDFLDPEIAPAVGTTVPGGATFREAHLIMEILHDSQLVTSLDLVELNPFLDERGRTATLLVDLVASLFGKTVMDRPTFRYN
ncbi:arginase [Rhodobacteraceae bacterium RKSG542]|uniref:arginase n=1 Tax=Pseudovibrio flavus TaxID=2529854 RepID=UPI0012BC8AED|nr:arginase [Pseudovibrio flavus]MTI17719.1 arginase [Pseudovibrio flavus]